MRIDQVLRAVRKRCCGNSAAADHVLSVVLRVLTSYSIPLRSKCVKDGCSASMGRA